ncbi:aldehyde dehydrogenase family protein [Nocardioides sp.]|uniref:aldehyde dehydrogenase family protein n=1 Tax=Nocardioides sp. TaxID=35761 RepID=UPI002639F66C|nr:aldehyde dehydrogenase family protein [Nocardioides sp.]
MTTPAPVVTRNPATGEVLATYPSHDEAGIEAAIAQTHAAFALWSRTPLADRLALLRTVGGLITERRTEFAALITAEMGKPICEALGEVDKCAWNCEVVADLAPGWLADHEIVSGASRSWLSYEPLGVVFAVMPWNFPFWQVLRFASAALAAGDTALLKHSPDVTGSALAIEQLFADAAAAHGAPAGLFRSVVVAAEDVAEVSRRIVEDDRIAAVTLTGSERAGAALASTAAAQIKKSVLELGGSDPFVVLADADVAAAATTAVKARFNNTGQSCVCAKRFIVHESIADEFVTRFLEGVALLRLGDPTDPATTIGPMARDDLRAQILRQIEASVAEGAQLVTGGAAIDAPGSWIEPTVLDHVTPGMTAFVEETFGPVAAIARARDDAHAIELANDTTFGLGASVWGATEHALEVGRQIRSGALFVNAMVASDPRIPFGGVGRSGYGRELSAEGVREFTNVRTMVVA